MTQLSVGSSSLVARAAADSRTAIPICSISTLWPGRNRRPPRPSRRLPPQGVMRCARWICRFPSASFILGFFFHPSLLIGCFPRYSRRGFLVYGGKGATGPLSDVWVRARWSRWLLASSVPLAAGHPLPPFARSVELCLWDPIVSILVSPRANPPAFSSREGLGNRTSFVLALFLSQPPKAVPLSLFPNLSSEYHFSMGAP